MQFHEVAFALMNGGPSCLYLTVGQARTQTHAYALLLVLRDTQQKT